MNRIGQVPPGFEFIDFTGKTVRLILQIDDEQYAIEQDERKELLAGIYCSARALANEPNGERYLTKVEMLIELNKQFIRMNNEDGNN